MEENLNEEDIWDEKSLKQLKRKLKTSSQERGKLSSTGSKNARMISSKRSEKNVKEGQSTQSQTDKRKCSASLKKEKKRRKRSDTSSNPNEKSVVSKTINNQLSADQCGSAVSSPSDKITPEKEVMDGFCPKCQMPFCALIGQSPGWHVRECLETKYSYVGMVSFFVVVEGTVYTVSMCSVRNRHRGPLTGYLYQCPCKGKDKHDINLYPTHPPPPPFLGCH